MGLRNYVLKNNEKPATHFIEVWRREEVYQSNIAMIHCLKEYLSDTSYAGAKTIAIFKIRVK